MAESKVPTAAEAKKQAFDATTEGIEIIPFAANGA
jgi:hypothetical protein